jgi:hypothetical protein
MKARFVLASTMFLVLLAISNTTIARVNISVGVSLPPLVISAPPMVAVIPGTDAYFCPDLAMDVYFYDGYWYRSYEGNWYRADDYNGPWGYIAVTNVPTFFFHLPANYRAVGYRRIPYADLHRNWRTWQKDRYWEHHAWGRNDSGRGREMGRHEAVQHQGERGGSSMHREMGVAPRFEEHHAPASGHTGHTHPMNKPSTPRAPAHGNEHGR